ncbi:glycosyltransferase [Stappia sp. GBMRC 2046]|uniref:Glycosyltransferase n=1 Tax=Stappia sediminis TaxID=2692190 RepID=A0A7X3S8L9_9HYPH|nr:glycosyltransferase [Stappia sediminis]MXN65968.1 glycosyltransferase [Stappia sediminis]
MRFDPDLLSCERTLSRNSGGGIEDGARGDVGAGYRWQERRIHPDLACLVRRGFNDVLASLAHAASARSKLAPGRILLDGGYISQETWCSVAAELCGVTFLPARTFGVHEISGADHGAGERSSGLLGLGTRVDDTEKLVVVPSPENLPALLEFFKRHEPLRRQICFASPEGIEYAAKECDPTFRLMVRYPESSASTRLSPEQGWFYGVAAAFTTAGMTMPPEIMALFTSVVTTGSSIALAVARTASAFSVKQPIRPASPLPDEKLPFYSVLVPLHREEAVASSLVHALSRLDYPLTRREILFLLEEDDQRTHLAIQKELGIGMRVIIVPEGSPRSKPRALMHGLAQARGELVTIFDGEDRPEPEQLRMAASAFAELPENVAALQAQLAVDHVDNRFLVRQFALEYAALFDRFLPWLAARNWPIPLGGTSNHFRREALERAGGWDPFNMTEDADLGIRLCRYGYSLEVLDSTTFEEAPLTWRIWHGQRTRWLKGWLQTLLVSFRDPPRLAGELDRPGLTVILVYFASIVMTLAFHPVFVLIVALHLSGLASYPLQGSLAGDCVVALAAGSLFMSYAGSLFAMASGAKRRAIRLGPRDVLGIPVYWLLQSLAFYHAVYEFIRRPHHWTKTPHGLANRPLIRNAEMRKAPQNCDTPARPGRKSRLSILERLVGRLWSG